MHGQKNIKKDRLCLHVRHVLLGKSEYFNHSGKGDAIPRLTCWACKSFF